MTLVGDAAVRHVVWDWNGTLLDDAELTIAATNASMVRQGHPPVPAEIYRTQFVRPLQLFYERLLGRPVSEAETEELDTAFHADYLALVGDAVLRPDAVLAIERVGQSGRHQSLLSMWPHEYLVPLVDRLELTHHFTRVDGNRERGRGGKAGMLDQHLRDLAVDPADVLMIGDSIDDADSARECGCRCILIDSGHAAPGALEATGAPVVTTLLDAVALAEGTPSL